MKHRALAFVASLLLLGALSAPALANTTVVDQKMEVTATNFSGGTTFAQTFTSGNTAPLSGVDLYLKSSSSIVVTVSIRPLDQTTKYPTNTSYSTGSATVKAEGWYHFNTPVDITTGAQYAIVFTLPASGGSNGATTHQYAGGSALVNNGTWGPFYNADTDFAFRTWVSLPTPTAVPTPKPTPVPTAAPTAAPTATAEPSATSSPSPSASAVASPELTTVPSIGSSESPTTAAAGSTGDSSGSDGAPIALIVVVVALLGIVGGAAGAFLLMRRKGTAPGAAAPADVEPKDVPPTQ